MRVTRRSPSFFGEYIACDVLKLPTISYAWSPGTQINTVATILAGAVVTLLVFWEQRKTRRQSNHTFHKRQEQ